MRPQPVLEGPQPATPALFKTALKAESKDWTLALLALMMVVVPSVGARGEGLLQDTLKSILVSSFVLTAAFAFFWRQRQQNAALNVHTLLVLPLGLMLYALGSMAWSHAYLGGVEAIRWFVFSLIFFWA